MKTKVFFRSYLLKEHDLQLGLRMGEKVSILTLLFERSINYYKSVCTLHIYIVLIAWSRLHLFSVFARYCTLTICL